jgi:hypothetical protein
MGPFAWTNSLDKDEKIDAKEFDDRKNLPTPACVLRAIRIGLDEEASFVGIDKQIDEEQEGLSTTGRAKEEMNGAAADLDTALSTVEFLLNLPIEGPMEEPLELIENAHKSCSSMGTTSFDNSDSNSFHNSHSSGLDRRALFHASSRSTTSEHSVSFRLRRRANSARSFDERMWQSSSDRLQLSLRDLALDADGDEEKDAPPATTEDRVHNNKCDKPSRRAQQAFFWRNHKSLSNLAYSSTDGGSKDQQRGATAAATATAGTNSRRRVTRSRSHRAGAAATSTIRGKKSVDELQALHLPFSGSRSRSFDERLWQSSSDGLHLSFSNLAATSAETGPSVDAQIIVDSRRRRVGRSQSHRSGRKRNETPALSTIPRKRSETELQAMHSSFSGSRSQLKVEVPQEITFCKSSAVGGSRPNLFADSKKTCSGSSRGMDSNQSSLRNLIMTSGVDTANNSGPQRNLMMMGGDFDTSLRNLMASSDAVVGNNNDATLFVTGSRIRRYDVGGGNNNRTVHHDADDEAEKQHSLLQAITA